MKQSELTARFAQRPQNYAWFIGAGASRNSGLPTAGDILQDMKLRYYCREENQDISKQDMQNTAVQARIQDFMDSRGFPTPWADEEYTAYFEKIFGDDRERQRKYISRILSEERITLSIGNRVIGAMMSEGLCRVVFTTNFDTVIEKSLAEIAGKSLSAYHLEGAGNAKNALDNEEYPFYCKLHGDFRYDSIKNLSEDLKKQNDELSACLINASNRFGFIISGYSGRDESVMALFHRALETTNPFPHGLYWTGIKGFAPHPEVTKLLELASQKGVDAHYVEIDTFDSFLLRLWRNLENKPSSLDDKVRKAQLTVVNIEIPSTGRQKPLLRLNALPIIEAPKKCLSFTSDKDWKELRDISFNAEHSLIFTKSSKVWCWGTQARIREAFGEAIGSISPLEIPRNITAPENLHVKGFIEEALALALTQNKPLLARTRKNSAYVIVDPHTDDVGALEPLFQVAGKPSGMIPGLFTPPTEDFPSQQIGWSEALRISVEYKNNKLWLLIDPDIWIWPPRSKQEAVNFLDKRRSNRFNERYNELLNAWISILLSSNKRDAEVQISAFSNGNDTENPSFRIGRRTAFSKRG